MTIEQRIRELATPDPRPVRLWYVTGTRHGSHVYSRSEGDARRTFHSHYNGESIVHIRCAGYPDPIPYYDPNDIDSY